jgi:hypothetical protein
MENKATPLVDDYLQNLYEMQPAATDEFFYTRLKARMEKDTAAVNWGLPLKPVWVIGMLTVLLAVNALMFVSKPVKQVDTSAEPLSLQAFAESYDLTVTPRY